ncbi:hypothetical protein FHS31_000808 [Sphingomonas vulcanisoli]|uniref:Uncharacterized protein n=1 Tax=Sphingomonas vulcanisoli TaxID=1658060 RepID=A0ABX0TS63_9SPHN|nr:hypothetical protein [Sphingomonas vulcanisoli]NIJ07212.1 hypothetical protein [Sphingomonas vulcanisoli]
MNDEVALPRASMGMLFAFGRGSITARRFPPSGPQKRAYHAAKLRRERQERRLEYQFAEHGSAAVESHEVVFHSGFNLFDQPHRTNWHGTGRPDLISFGDHSDEA